MLKRRPFQEFLDTALKNCDLQGLFAARNVTTEYGHFAHEDAVLIWGSHPSGHISLPDNLMQTYAKGQPIAICSSAVGCEDHFTASIEFDQGSEFVNGFTLHGNSQYPFDWLILIRK